MLIFVFTTNCSFSDKTIYADENIDVTTGNEGSFQGIFSSVSEDHISALNFEDNSGKTVVVKNCDGYKYSSYLVDSLFTFPDKFTGKIFKVKWKKDVWNNDEGLATEAPCSADPYLIDISYAISNESAGEKNEILSSENNSEEAKKNTDEASGEEIKLEDGKLIIKYNGKTILVHKPHSVTNFCTAKFENLRLGGYSDWRLPTPEELKVIYKHRDLLGLNTNSNMNAYDVSKLLFGDRSAPVNEVWSSDYSEDKVSSTEEEYKHHYGGGGAYYNSRSEKTYYNVTTLNIITGEIKKQNSYRCGHGGDRAILIPVRDAD